VVADSGVAMDAGGAARIPAAGTGKKISGGGGISCDLRMLDGDVVLIFRIFAFHFESSAVQIVGCGKRLL